MTRFQEAIRELSKSHLMEMKNLKSHAQRPIIYQLLSYIVQMLHNVGVESSLVSLEKL